FVTIFRIEAADVRSMKRHQPGLLKGEMEGGDVGESDEDLRSLHQRREIEERQEARRAIAAARADDALHFRVGERFGQLRRAPLVAAGEIAIDLEEIVAPGEREAELLPGRDAAVEPLAVEARRRRDDADRVAGHELR